MNLLASFAVTAGLLPLGLVPPNVDQDRNYPGYVDLVSNFSDMVGYQNADLVLIDRRSELPLFDYGTAYLAVSATASYDDQGNITLQSVDFAKFKAQSGGFSAGYAIQESWNVAFPWSFAFLTPSTGYFNLYEYGAYVMGQFDDWAKFEVDSISYTHKAKGIQCNSYYVNNTSGPYPLRLNVSAAEVLDMATPYLAEYFYFPNGYEVGYSAGKRVGVEEGKTIGYNVGYQVASEELNSAGGLITALFAGVVGIPISVINGLGGFAVLNVPIVSILISMLVLSIVIFIIKRII